MYKIWNCYKKNSHRLFSIFYKYLDGEKIVKIVNKEFINNGKTSDTDIYKLLRSRINSDKVFSIKGEKIRANIRAKRVLSIVKQLKRREIITNRLKSHLDIGTGKGFIALAIKKKLNIDTYAIDISDNRHKQVKHELKKFKVYDGVSIPYTGFDLITLMMVLHHVEKLKPFLKMLHKSLNDNGIIIVREHNAKDHLTKELIDIQHELFNCVYSKDPTPSQYSNYMSKTNLIKVMAIAGFKHINVKILFGNNPTKYYYIVFIKKTKKS
jgi:2-polyprenyl-3-methyl-5-hydroxy-6-metoxy-1,4-benzoquinol methylase